MDQSEVLKFERAQVGTITLSEAIRQGSKIRGQSHFGMFEGGRSCAQGAAAEALGFKYNEACSEGTAAMIFLRSKYPSCALLGHFGPIAKRNDYSGGLMWSREKIADWLEAQGY